MTRRRQTRPELDESLLASMQAGVARRESSTDVRGTDSSPNAAGASNVARPLPHPTVTTDLLTMTGTGHQKAKSRTTLSVPCAVGEHARRLTLALSLAEGLEASIGATVQRALTLLEAKLKSEGVAVSGNA